MKIAGIEIAGELAQPNVDVLVLPRSKSQIIFTAQALFDMKDFEERVPVQNGPDLRAAPGYR